MNILEITDEEARREFHRLGKERAAILAVSEPLRAKRDADEQDRESRRAKADAKLREAEAGLFEIDRARGRLAKMLGGRTGLPDGTVPEGE